MELELHNPPINCYLHHAYPLTVAMSHKDFNAWFYSNYIQLEYFINGNTLNFLTYPISGFSSLCPLLDYERLDLEFIYKSNINVIDLIKNSISLGYYVMTYTDEYYIPDRISYERKIHFRHEIMIYGFDSDKSVFNVIGFNKELKYSPSCVSFSEFETSYLNSINKTNDFILMKAKDSKSYRPSYEFDIVNVKNLLTDYLFSKNTSENFRLIGKPNNGICGISVYDELIKYYQNILNDDSGKVCDIKHFHLLYEHKKAMVSRLEYLAENKYINSNNDITSIFGELEKKSLNMRNIIMKYNSTKNKKHLNYIIDSLPKMYQIEKKAI